MKSKRKHIVTSILPFIIGYCWVTIITLPIAAGLTACSETSKSEEIKETYGNGYIQIKLMVPTSSRSITNVSGGSDNGTEAGEENENTLNVVDLYFTDSSGGIILSSTGLIPEKTEDQNGQNENGVEYRVKSAIHPQSFATLFAGKKMKLYVVANASNPELSDGVLNGILPYPEIIPYGEEGQFIPMTNKEESGVLDFSTKTIPELRDLFNESTDYTLDISATSTMGGIGKISMERVLSRLDYDDAPRGDGSSLPSIPNLYPLSDTGIFLKVIKMEPVNVKGSSYLFRHTATGTEEAATGIPEIFGTENGGIAGKYNWIADNDWDVKKSSSILENAINSSVIINGEVSLPADWTDVATLIGNDFTDNDDAYHPWCYVSENTLPSVDKMKQGLSTGVAFKVLLCNGKGNPLTVVPEEVKGVSLDFDALTISMGGVTRSMIQEPDGFTLNYFYWIRHNDNGLPGITAPMEFGVVRNNIYKMRIMSFSGLPEAYDPVASDEEEILGIRLETTVKPWEYYRINVDI